MDNNVMFNLTVTLTGFVILLVHSANVLMKRVRRRDENALLAFLLFTSLHFAVYFIFTLIRTQHTSDPLIMSFYTGFYIANNLEVFLLFIYMLSYLELSQKTKKNLFIFNFCLLLAFVILDFINIPTHIFFHAENGQYVRASTMAISQGYQFTMLAIVFFMALFHKKLGPREKVGFSLYCLLPLLAIVVQNLFPGYAIAYLSMIVAIEILFFFLSVQRYYELVAEEKKSQDAQVRVMLSQIQPHFIYNSLSSISTLITIDPEKAQNALDNFTEYLRSNLSSLTGGAFIPFVDELRHIKTYVSLETLRFGERITVTYDIQAEDFNIPPLTIQPIVENAVKHGILAKLEGGTVQLRTYETEKAYIVEVEDDGVGFDTSKAPSDGRSHFGMKSIEQRLKILCKSKITIDSQIGKGTKVTITFFKGEKV